MQAYESVKDVILRIVDEVLRSSEAETPDKTREQGKGSWLEDVQRKAGDVLGKVDCTDGWHIYTTGHSMGGALATLCAHELAVSRSFFTSIG